MSEIAPQARTLTRGQRAELSLADHRARLKVLFEENEARISPDSALRSALLDADRFADEFAALAPPAQTQQGLSEELLTYFDGLVDQRRRGLGPNITDAAKCMLDEIEVFMRAAIERVRRGEYPWGSGLTPMGGPLNLEKQPSPAAAPAQLSEVRKALEAASSFAFDIGENWTNGFGVRARRLHAKIQAAQAALAGQPAPTEDREALRAAAEDDAMKAARILDLAEIWAAIDRAEGDNVMTAEGMAAHDDLLEACRALAGSPAQRAQSIETPAIEKPEQGQLGKKGGG
jgi:hypothetical protein